MTISPEIGVLIIGSILLVFLLLFAILIKPNNMPIDDFIMRILPILLAIIFATLIAMLLFDLDIIPTYFINPIS